MDIGEFDISDKTSFWTYLVNKKSWDNLLNNFNENEQYYLFSFSNSLINSNDIVIIYVKDIGVKGIVQIFDKVDRSSVNNNPFKDENIMKNC